MVCRLISQHYLRLKKPQDHNYTLMDELQGPEHLPLLPTALPDGCTLEVAEMVLKEVEDRVVKLIQGACVIGLFSRI